MNILILLIDSGQLRFAMIRNITVILRDSIESWSLATASDRQNVTLAGEGRYLWVGIHSSVLLVVILGRSVALFGIYWPSRSKGRLEGLGRSPAFPSFIVFSTRWKESRLNGV